MPKAIIPEQLSINDLMALNLGGLTPFEYSRQNNLKFYYTGKLCINGHIDKRYTTTKQCCTCSYQKARRWAKANPEKLISKYREKKYGITTKEVTKLTELQDNRCAVCENIFKNTRNINVDHNHKTGKIREILCIKCNTMLGLADDNIEILEKAIKYLKKHEINNP